MTQSAQPKMPSQNQQNQNQKFQPDVRADKSQDKTRDQQGGKWGQNESSPGSNKMNQKPSDK